MSYSFQGRVTECRRALVWLRGQNQSIEQVSVHNRRAGDPYPSRNRILTKKFWFVVCRSNNLTLTRILYSGLIYLFGTSVGDGTPLSFWYIGGGGDQKTKLTESSKQENMAKRQDAPHWCVKMNIFHSCSLEGRTWYILNLLGVLPF